MTITAPISSGIENLVLLSSENLSAHNNAQLHLNDSCQTDARRASTASDCSDFSQLLASEASYSSLGVCSDCEFYVAAFPIKQMKRDEKNLQCFVGSRAHGCHGACSGNSLYEKDSCKPSPCRFGQLGPPSRMLHALKIQSMAHVPQRRTKHGQLKSDVVNSVLSLMPTLQTKNGD